MIVTTPLRTGRGQNDREHYMARARRVKKEREAIGWALAGKTRPTLPCTVLLTRVAPGNGLDSDNLSGSQKGVRDAVAQWLGLDDADPQVKWLYAQRRGPWGVEVSISGALT
jgi:hypothetical protein